MLFLTVPALQQPVLSVLATTDILHLTENNNKKNDYYALTHIKCYPRILKLASLTHNACYPTRGGNNYESKIQRRIHGHYGQALQKSKKA